MNGRILDRPMFQQGGWVKTLKDITGYPDRVIVAIVNAARRAGVTTIEGLKEFLTYTIEKNLPDISQKGIVSIRQKFKDFGELGLQKAGAVEDVGPGSQYAPTQPWYEIKTDGGKVIDMRSSEPYEIITAPAITADQLIDDTYLGSHSPPKFNQGGYANNMKLPSDMLPPKPSMDAIRKHNERIRRNKRIQPNPYGPLTGAHKRWLDHYNISPSTTDDGELDPELDPVNNLITTDKEWKQQEREIEERYKKEMQETQNIRDIINKSAHVEKDGAISEEDLTKIQQEKVLFFDDYIKDKFYDGISPRELEYQWQKFFNKKRSASKIEESISNALNNLYGLKEATDQYVDEIGITNTDDTKTKKANDKEVLKLSPGAMDLIKKKILPTSAKNNDAKTAGTASTVGPPAGPSLPLIQTNTNKKDPKINVDFKNLSYLLKNEPPESVMDRITDAARIMAPHFLKGRVGTGLSTSLEALGDAMKDINAKREKDALAAAKKFENKAKRELEIWKAKTSAMATIKAAKVRAGSKPSQEDKIKSSLFKNKEYHLIKAIAWKRKKTGTPVPDISKGVKNMYAGKWTLRQLEDLLNNESFKKMLHRDVIKPK